MRQGRSYHFVPSPPAATSSTLTDSLPASGSDPPSFGTP
uniref:PPR containing plant-like protein n=1 Tax=Rhizophora mucronata TaxID=61149 RepID=A0A2P2NNW7_RHIMU